MGCNCNICNQQSNFLFDTVVLQKHLVKYYKCQNCGFIQTENPYWLNEAYSSPIALIDVGLLQRNVFLSEKISEIIDNLIPFDGTYLDYGGGYGIFVRLMRDKGYDFYLDEKYTQNIFAKYFELKDSGFKTDFTCLTAFEVFEHLVNPVKEIEEMFALSKTIVFSTELQLKDDIKKANDWWYFVPEGGQHVSLYSLNSLMHLKKHFNCHLYTNKHNLHVLSRVALKDPFEKIIAEYPSLSVRIKNRFFNKNKRTENLIKRESLLMNDFEYYKNKLSDGEIQDTNIPAKP